MEHNEKMKYNEKRAERANICKTFVYENPECGSVICNNGYIRFNFESKVIKIDLWQKNQTDAEEREFFNSLIEALYKRAREKIQGSIEYWSEKCEKEWSDDKSYLKEFKDDKKSCDESYVKALEKINQSFVKPIPNLTPCLYL